jgi:hypothetical protein
MSVKTSIPTRRSCEDWRRLGLRALKELGSTEDIDRWPAAVIREMARGQRAYPRALAEKVAEIYKRDLATRELITAYAKGLYKKEAAHA